jgi:hypothetical protein
MAGLDDQLDENRDIKCVICHELPHRPVACSECPTLMCAGCISDWLNHDHKNCPHCNQDFVPNGLIEMVIKSKDGSRQTVKCYACTKPFLLFEWDKHRAICEKSKIECCCGSVVQASHKLDEAGKLMGDQYSGAMTAFDIHIWFECEKVKSNCVTCGYTDTREQFDAGHLSCDKWNG